MMTSIMGITIRATVPPPIPSCFPLSPLSNESNKNEKIKSPNNSDDQTSPSPL